MEALREAMALADRGEFLRAYDICCSSNGEDESGGSPEWSRLLARCCAALGLHDRAIEVLASCGGADGDPETAALLGGIHKRRWLFQRDSGDGEAGRSLELACEFYLRSHRQGGGYWSGINGATLSCIRGDASTASSLADSVIETCWAEYGRYGTSSPFWTLATLGEAHLVKGEYGIAKKWFQAARSHLGGNFGWVASTRVNARILLESARADPEITRQILDSIPELGMAVFAGHRLDRPQRRTPRFPSDITEGVTQKLRKALIGLRLDMGIASVADGADILFHECMHDLRRATIAVLPSPPDHFRARLAQSTPPEWLERYDRVMSKVDRVEVSSESRFDTDPDAVHALCADFMLGYSIGLSREYDARLVPIVVWDGRESRRVGGTAYTVSRLAELGLEATVLSLPSSGRQAGATRGFQADVDLPSGCSASLLVSVKISHLGRTEEDHADAASGLVETLSRISRACSMRVTQSGGFHGRFYAILEPVDKAGRFVEACLSELDRRLIISILFHAGISLRAGASASSGFSLCRDLNGPMGAVEDIPVPGGFFCTLQMKSLLALEKGLDRRFGYMGLHSSPDGSMLRLYSIE